MKNSTKIILALAVVAIVLGTAYEFRYHPESYASISPVNTTNSSAKILSKTMDLSTAAGTTTSILIPQDYAVVSSFAYCTGVGTSKTAYTGTGLASLQINGATTSSAISGNLADSNTNYFTSGMVLGTSTPFSFASSTTDVAGVNRYLPAATYATFSANATNTAFCTVGVYVLAL